MASHCSDEGHHTPDGLDGTIRPWGLASPTHRAGRAVRHLALPLCLLAVPLLAQQADRTRTEALVQRATERLQALHLEADRLASAERTLLGEIRKLQIDREIKAEELAGLKAESTTVAADLATATERIHALEAQELAERPDLRGRLVSLYKLGPARYLKLLLSTPELRQIGRASRLVAALAKIDRDRLAARQQTLDALNATRAALGDRSARLASLRTNAERAEKAMATAVRARDDLVADIDRRRDLTAQLAGELQAAQQNLQLTLRDLTNGRPTTDPVLLPLRPFRGDLDWPVSGAVRRPFAQGGASVTSTTGVEIAAAEGSPVRAIHDGTVAFADTFAGFGNLVIIDHGSQTFSLYGYLLDIAVKKDARIDRGQVLGAVGMAPAGPAGLYFELRVDGQPADPLQWLRKP